MFQFVYYKERNMKELFFGVFLAIFIIMYICIVVCKDDVTLYLTVVLEVFDVTLLIHH